MSEPGDTTWSGAPRRANASLNRRMAYAWRGKATSIECRVDGRECIGQAYASAAARR